MGVLAEAYADARLNTKTFDKDVKALLAKVEKAAVQAEKALNLDVDINTSNATKAITNLQRQLLKLDALDPDIEIEANTTKATTAIKNLNGQLALLDEHLNISADADTGDVITQLQALDVAASKLDGRDIDIDVDVDGAAEATAEITALDTAATRASDNMGKNGRRGRGPLLFAIGLGAVAAAAAAAGAAMGAFGVVVAASFEQVSVAFEGTLGSAEKARSFIAELENFAAVTPFEFDQLTSSAQRLLGVFGKSFQSELVPTLTIIGDVASSLGVSAEGIDRVTVALGQIKGKGKAMAQELQQISEALPGFSAIKVIAKELGLSVPQAFKQVELGAVDADTAIEAILNGMKDFPGAAGAMERQSQTLVGRLSTLRDNLKIAAREGFDPLFDSVKQVTTDALGPLEQALTKIAPSVNKAFLSLAPALFPFLEELSEGFAKVLDGIGPGLTALLRGLTPALVPLGEILGRIGEVVGATGAALLAGLVPALEVLAAILTSIPVPVLSALTVAIIGLKVATAASKAIDALNLAMASFGRTGIGPISLALTALSAVVVGITAAFQGNAAKQRELQQITDATADALQRLTDEFLATTDAANGFNPDVATADLFGKALTDAGAEADKLKEVLSDLGLTTDDLLGILSDVSTRGIGGTETAMGRLNNAFGSNAPMVADLIDQYDDLSGVFGILDGSATGATEPLIKLNAEQEELIRTLEELQDQAEKTDIASIATQYLDSAAASDEATKALVEQAEAIAGVSRDSDNSIAVYTEFIRLQGEAATAAANAGDGFNDFGAALGRASLEADKFSGFILHAVEPFDAAAAAANGFNAALDRIINRQLGAAGAATNLGNTMGSIAEQFATAGLEGEELAAVQQRIAAGFDGATAAGRENQALAQAAAGDILALASAELEAGASLVDVEGKTNLRVEALKQELIATGLSKEAVDAYIATLGLTPSNVKTAIEQTGAEQAEAEVADYQKQLEAIDDKEYVALVRAQTDDAAMSAATAALDRLTQARYARIIPTASGNIQQFMAGGRIGGPGLSAATGWDGAFSPAMVGEAGREMVWLPKGAEVLNNSTTERLLSAMERQGPVGKGGNSRPTSTVARIHPDDIRAMAATLADMMPPLATIEVPYTDADAIASKLAARWRQRPGRF